MFAQLLILLLGQLWTITMSLYADRLNVSHFGKIYMAWHCIYTEPSGVFAQWLISRLTKIVLNKFKSSSNTLKYYLYGLYPDSATIFNISVKTKCKQTNPRFLTNVATSGDIAHAYFGWFLKWIKERFYFQSFRNWSLYLFLQNKLKFENIWYLVI